jgi:hypothetical protein
MAIFRKSQRASASGAAPGERLDVPVHLSLAPLTEEADEFLTACNVEFNDKQDELIGKLVDGHDNWGADLEQAVLWFTWPEGRKLVFDIEVVGSFSPATRTWEWGWNNPNVEEALAVPKEPLLEAGDKYDLEYLRVGFFFVRKGIDLREFSCFLSGVALKLRGALYAYEAPHDKGSLFLLLRNPREE